MSVVSNKSKNGFTKHTKKLCLQAVQDARQASALKVIKKREKDTQVKTLFFKIENSSFTCMGAQFWLEMSSIFTKIIEKWFQKGTNCCRNASRTPPLENHKKAF